MLTAINSITIHKPATKVWEFLTEPNKPQTWIGEDNELLISSWNINDPVTWKNEDGTDYYRGTITQREPNKVLAFTIHDAFAEDEYDPDFGEDWNYETWQFSLVEKDGATTLTLSVGDYDSEHDTDSEHDHAETEQACINMQTVIIPQKLAVIRHQVENR